MPRGIGWTYTSKPAAGVKVDAPSTPSPTILPADRLKEIQTAVEASPNKIAVIFARDHQVPGPSMHASKLAPFADGSRSWDHVAIAWMDANGNLVFAEARPENGALGVATFGKNSPGTAAQLVTEYKDFKVLPIDLSRYGPGARDAFVNTVSAATGPGSFYTLTNKNIGTVCSGAIGKGFEAAREVQKPTPPAVKYLKESYQRISTLGLNLTKWNVYSPKDAYLDAQKHSVPFRFDPKAPLVKREWSVVGQPKIVVVETDNAEVGASPVSNSQGGQGAFNRMKRPSASFADTALAGATLLSPEARASQDEQKPLPQELKDPSDEARTSQHPRVDDEHRPLPQELKDLSDDEDDEDALTDQALQDREIDADDDEDDSEDEVNLASAPQDARTHDAPQEPEIDDDADDDDDTLIDDAAPQPVIDDDDDEPSQEDDDEDEELVDASGAEDAPAADAPVMQTAKAEAGADATGDDQPGPQLATSASVTAEDGFSFSLFPKPAVPTEVAKDAMPIDPAPTEESSSSGAPGGEGAHPDLQTADVGHAAPGKDPVVHHGDLAP